MRILFLFGLAFCFVFAGSPSDAKIYKWKDEEGKLHFTDDLRKVPKRPGIRVDMIRERVPARQRKAPGINSSSKTPGKILDELGDPFGLNPQGKKNKIQPQLSEKKLKKIEEQIGVIN